MEVELLNGISIVKILLQLLLKSSSKLSNAADML